MILWRPPAVPPSPVGEAWPAFERVQRSGVTTTGYVSQPAHARLAGEIAGVLLPEIFGELSPEVVEAIARHDTGWAEADLRALEMYEAGEPETFVTLAPEPAIESWRRSIGEAERRSAVEGALSCRHFLLLAPRDEAHAAFREAETARCTERERTMELDGAMLARATGALGFCDLLSLLLCCGYRGRVRMSLAHPADREAAERAEQVEIELGEGAIECSRPVFREVPVSVQRWRRARHGLLPERAEWVLG